MENNKSPKQILLIDMDGVIADYYGAFLLEWMKRYPDREILYPYELNSFYIEDVYPPKYKNDILEITRSKGFFLNLPVIRGAQQALSKIAQFENVETFLCTAPDLDTIEHCCSSEKFQWVENHFGKEWAKKTIITKDKTLVFGSYLIDDKPIITGAITPAWESIIFTHQYNIGINGKRLNGWDNWEKVLSPALNLK